MPQSGNSFGKCGVKCEFLQVDSFINKPVNLTKVLQVVRDLKRFWLNDVVLPKLDE